VKFSPLLGGSGRGFAKTGYLEGNLHDTAWIEGVEALVGTIIFEVSAEFFC
jgi:hypothetical protein